MIATFEIARFFRRNLTHFELGRPDGRNVADILLAPAGGWDQIPRQSAGMIRATIQVGDVNHY